jgi:hypothetical protein
MLANAINEVRTTENALYTFSFKYVEYDFEMNCEATLFDEIVRQT